MTIFCAGCGGELYEPGGLMLGPPDPAPYAIGPQRVTKMHICIRCWPHVIAAVAALQD